MPSVQEIAIAIGDREAEMRSALSREGWVSREMATGWSGPTVGATSLITGPRRAGKSVFAFQEGLRSGRFAYVSFEDERLQLRGEELNRILEAVLSLKGEVDLLILDEVQNIEGWERFVSRITPGRKVVVTGSNARLMSRELATFLTGRHVDRELFPFSFREFLAFRRAQLGPRALRTTPGRVRGYGLLQEYLAHGGFPPALSLGKSYHSELYRDVVERDVLARFRIRHASRVRDLARYLMSNPATEISYLRLGKLAGVSGTHTVANWVQYLKDAYLVVELNRFSFKLKEQSRAPKKIYAMDTGMMNAVAFLPSDSHGRSLENLVAVELLRRRSYWARESEVYYWKDHMQREVDFVVKEGTRVTQLIQVTSASSERDVAEREIESLVRASEELRCRDLLVITWDHDGEVARGGRRILFRPVLDWLLEVEGPTVGSEPEPTTHLGRSESVSRT